MTDHLDIVELQELLEFQQVLIERIASGAPIGECLEAICYAIESLFKGVTVQSSILLLCDEHLYCGAAPSLNPEYNAIIDGILIGPNVGSCGTAAYKKQPVIIEDVLKAQEWHKFTNLAEQFGFRSCWSFPIFDSNKMLVGTFAIYQNRPALPTEKQSQWVERLSHFASVIIERSAKEHSERRLRQTIQNNNERLKAFAAVLPDVCLIIDEHGTYVDVYGEDKKALATDANKLIGKTLMDVMPAKEAEKFMAVLKKTLEMDKTHLLEYELTVLKGLRYFEARTRYVPMYNQYDPNLKHVLWMVRDITDQRHAADQIQHLAFYDSLTGLPNRRLFFDKLHQHLDIQKVEKKYSGLLFLDIDDFKRINDSLGHSVGDELLVIVANRLLSVARNVDTVSRLGGDEFVLLLNGVSTSREKAAEEASQVAKRILSAFSSVFRLEGEQYWVNPSIGIALIEPDETKPDDILKRADSAMYSAKRNGGKCYAFYDPALQSILDYRLQIERGLRTAITEGHIQTYFQPQISISGLVIGVEALVRWVDPEKGIVSPAEFIPIAERSGLIQQLQQVVLEQSCAALLAINPLVPTKQPLTVSINISATQFNSGNLRNELVSTISRFGLSSRQFMLEITESILMEKKIDIGEQMQQLRSDGFRFSIDDFGTGYSSLSYLHDFPIDELKIDQSFIARIGQQEESLGIVDAIISMAEYLGFDVIAEGVEDEYQKRTLSQRRVHGLQGYLFAKPMPMGEQLLNTLKKYV